MTAVGRPTPRSDGRVKVSGAARYTVDLALPGMLHAVLVRSREPAARIVRLDTSAAAALPGVHAVITAADAPRHGSGLVVWDQPIFATDVVRYEGEPIAAIAADSLQIAHAAAALVVVELEAIPPVVDVDAAVAPGARLIHPNWTSYRSIDDAPPRRDNVAAELVSRPRGDVDAAFADADHVVTGEYRVARQYQAYLEPKGVVAEYEDDRYVLHVSHQHPFGMRDRFADAFGIRTSRVRVVGHHIGGGFGAKLDLGIEPYAALLAERTRRPVRLVHDRQEDMLTCPSRENAVMRVQSAVMADGRIIGRRLDVLLDCGAYAGDTPFLCSIPLFLAGAPYRAGTVEVRTRAVYTNTTPTGAFRGVAGAGLTFALERHLDEIARTIDMDRRELRLRNLLDDGEEMLNGQPLDDVSIVRQAFAALDERAPWDAPRRAPEPEVARGVGMAALVWLTNPLPSGATLKLGEDGTVRVISGATDNGSGAVTQGLRQIAADELGIDPDDVLVSFPDTDVSAWDGGSQGSRTTHVAGRAVRDAAVDLRARILDVVADKMEAVVEDLELADGRVGVRGVPSRHVALATAAGWALESVGPLQGTGSYVVPQARYDPSCASGLMFKSFTTPTYHAHFAEVDVDLVTGRVSVVRYVVVQEVGKAINPAAVRGQIQGAVTQGIGYALHEGLDIDADGRYRQRTLEAYRLPIAPDVPRVEIVLLEHPDAGGPFGAKGIAEPPLVPVAAAIANAVSDAIGVPVDELPLRPDRVLELLAARDDPSRRVTR